MAEAKKAPNPYKTHWYNRRFAYWFNKHATRQEGIHARPPVIHLAPLAGVKPDGKPAVRIFLGTEPAQRRAERVFIFAVEKMRNPARAYEIHLMTDIAGLDRSAWKTGFTNYRYCIPEWAGGEGRAIYNDVDQIYLADPAEMFDMDLGGKGIAAVTAEENSVMLIDCAKMKPLWTMADIKAGKSHGHFKSIVTANKLLAPLPGPWNARDGEYPVNESKCIHYTTLHTQPWEPFPDQLRYGESPVASAWHDLEREADRTGYQQPDAD